jgi:hypothetical protein
VREFVDDDLDSPSNARESAGMPTDPNRRPADRSRKDDLSSASEER